MSTFTDIKLSADQMEGDATQLFHHVSAQAVRRRENRLRFAVGVWFTSTLLLAALSAWLGLQLRAATRFGSFERGFHTELDAPKHLIELEEKWFEASPAFLDDGFEYVPEREDGTPRTKYVGEPTKDIDHNWEQLHWGRFFLLTEDEAKKAWGPGYEKYWAPREGGYIAASLEVMHTVHCLDHIRRAFYPDIYPNKNPIHGTKHRDHCIEHLRQIILCNSDLTPIPSIFYIGVEDNYINSDRPHTCRNFQKIRDFVSDRFNGSSRVAPRPGTVWSEEWINTDRPHS
ncbi:hypothetical protein GCG54_00012730 [Colletotrichum gloeosporioides]|uniref:Tat pathway signal sequence n=1 Tax=Colletotrichum gloeosporioides TaxID=474922 RepID=A0A8H4FQG9_COLGL|nr:uncharacterized protein GCG54_00012730 [Colletotrichum gloeosporioides]KAF3809449.1 hypothetical protein GCG54_00012730 [Colletotrichum gloeosporioides]